jgi:MFS family permease
VWRLLTAPEPLIPIAILKDPVARCAIIANGCGWGPIVGFNIFLPMYLQSVLGLSATAAGLSLMVVMVSLNTSAGLCSPILARATHYKRLPIAALIVAIVAAMTLAVYADRMNLWLFEILVILIGFGFGAVPPLTSVALQNTVAIHHFGTAVGTMNFSRHLYATFLIAAFGAIVLSSVPSLDPAALTSEASRAAGTAQTAAAFSRVFFAGAASFCIALIALVLMQEKPLIASR